jgi:hypothetical protein
LTFLLPSQPAAIAAGVRGRKLDDDDAEKSVESEKSVDSFGHDRSVTPTKRSLKSVQSVDSFGVAVAG